MFRLTRPFRVFFAHEASGGALLAVAAVVALALANSSASAVFEEFRTAPRIGHFSIEHIVNDGLMALFFFVVGMEIKRELVWGELSSFRRALLPALAAAGGMIGPAICYAALNHGGEGARGWGIPTATDIAFVVGALSILGKRVPSGLAVFVVALAVFDDIGGVALIAIFYGGGIHSSIIGVIVALLVPKRWLADLISKLHPIQVYLIMPIFALVNAGVDVRGLPEGAWTNRVLLGTAIGLFFGKQLGIFFTTMLAVKLRVADLPSGGTWSTLYGVSILAGIGFTVALFVAALAFHGDALNLAKAGVLLGSAASGLAGYLWLAARARVAAA